MTKNLLKGVMIKAEKDAVDTIGKNEMIEKIQHGYIINRGPKHTQKKTFAQDRKSVV